MSFINTDYTDPSDIEKEFHNNKIKIRYLGQRIKLLEASVKQHCSEIEILLERIDELENVVHYGPNSKTMMDAKSDFESRIS